MLWGKSRRKIEVRVFINNDKLLRSPKSLYIYSIFHCNVSVFLSWYFTFESVRKRYCASVNIKSSRDITLVSHLLFLKMVSQYVNPHQFTAAAAAYSDNVELSIDKFPLWDGREETNEVLYSKISFRPRYSKENTTLFAKGRYWYDLEVLKIMSHCDTAQ